MAGRRPTPDALKDLTGSHNKRNGRAPRTYTYRSFDTLPHLKDVEREPRAKELWDEMSPELIAAGLLTKASILTWSFCCIAYASACHAQDDVFDNGRWIEIPIFSGKGEHVGDVRKPNPAIKQAHEARQEMLRYAIEFGITPAAATRVQVEPGDERKSDDFGDFMSTPEETESNDEPRLN